MPPSLRPGHHLHPGCYRQPVRPALPTPDTSRQAFPHSLRVTVPRPVLHVTFHVRHRTIIVLFIMVFVVIARPTLRGHGHGRSAGEISAGGALKVSERDETIIEWTRGQLDEVWGVCRIRYWQRFDGDRRWKLRCEFLHAHDDGTAYQGPVTYMHIQRVGTASVWHRQGVAARYHRQQESTYARIMAFHFKLMGAWA